MPSRYLDRPGASPDHLNSSLDLPYGMTARAIGKAVDDVYAYLHVLNGASVDSNYGRLEELVQPPANFSGFLSNVFVRAVAARTGSARPGLAVNRHHNGRPDLVPRVRYEGDAVRQGAEGVEVKASRSKSSWQGHNPESGWLMVLRFAIAPTKRRLAAPLGAKPDRSSSPRRSTAQTAGRPNGTRVRAGTDNRGRRHARQAGRRRLELRRPGSRQPADTHGVRQPVGTSEAPGRDDLRPSRSVAAPRGRAREEPEGRRAASAGTASFAIAA